MLISKFPRAVILRPLLLAVPAAWICLAAPAQQTEPTREARNPDEALDRAIAKENQLIQKLKTMEPVVETYIQQMQRDEDLGAIPKTDNYFLGKLDLSGQVDDDSFIPAPGFFKRSVGVFTHFFSPDFLPRGFAQMVLMDEDGFDRSHYTFQYVRREFLGDVRTLVYDVLPQKSAGHGRFVGRIWIEDEDYNVVRFNGTFGPSSMRSRYTHFDSWRVNCGPNLWLPSYVYTEEGSMSQNGGLRHVAFKAQTRLWGYESQKERRNEEFTNMTVDSSQGVNDKSDQASDTSPVEAQRLWERQAEDNILDRLQDSGLIAPPGDVDKILTTVLTNLEITNNISVTPEMRARVMMTTPMESVYVGHTILMSRGLLDVLPDEATLAAVIAHEFAHVLLGHQLDTKYAFTDRLFFRDDQTLERMDLARTEREEDAADEKAIEMLKKSPYAGKLPKAGLFLKMLSARGDELPHLIRPLIGNRMAASSKDLRMAGLMEQAPPLEVDRIDQISALPLGSRVRMDPWNDQLFLMKTRNVALLTPREKFPFEITPFMLHLTRGSIEEKHGL
jgi:Peptidase family M48